MRLELRMRRVCCKPGARPHDRSSPLLSDWRSRSGRQPGRRRVSLFARPALVAAGRSSCWPIAARVNPLVRRVHGSWVGSTFGLWITQMSLAALARDGIPGPYYSRI